MRKVFHFVSAFGASIASYMGVEPENVAKDDVNPGKEINIVSDNENTLESNDFNFPINEALLNNKKDNTGVVLIVNDDDQNSDIIQPDESVAVDSESDGIEEANDQQETKIAAIQSNIKPDTIDTELAPSILEQMDSVQVAVVEEERNISRDLEVSGLIMDETRSKIGRDFYDYFFNNWNAQPHIKSYYSILIEERPVRGSVSQITVTVNENVVMRQFIQLRNSEIEDMADRAVYRVQRYLAKENDIRNRLLEESDQMGSGIF